MNSDQVSALFGDLTVAQLVLWLIAASLLLGLLGALGKRLWPLLKGSVVLADLLKDLPAFMLEMKAAVEAVRLASAEQRADVAEMKVQLGEVHHEVHYNNGSSVKDAVDRTESGVYALSRDVNGLRGQVAAATEAIEELHKKDAELGRRIEDTLPRPPVNQGE